MPMTPPAFADHPANCPICGDKTQPADYYCSREESLLALEHIVGQKGTH